MSNEDKRLRKKSKVKSLVEHFLISKIICKLSFQNAQDWLKVTYYSYPKKKYQNFEICEIKAK